jgi:hypothetical protein
MQKGGIALKNKSKFAEKILCCFMILCFITCPMNAVHAASWDDKIIGDIGVDINWFDFGGNYNGYWIQEVMGTGYYEISMAKDA